MWTFKYVVKVTIPYSYALFTLPTTFQLTIHSLAKMHLHIEKAFNKQEKSSLILVCDEVN